MLSQTPPTTGNLKKRIVPPNKKNNTSNKKVKASLKLEDLSDLTLINIDNILDIINLTAGKDPKKIRFEKEVFDKIQHVMEDVMWGKSDDKIEEMCMLLMRPHIQFLTACESWLQFLALEYLMVEKKTIASRSTDEDMLQDLFRKNMDNRSATENAKSSQIVLRSTTGAESFDSLTIVSDDLECKRGLQPGIDEKFQKCGKSSDLNFIPKDEDYALAHGMNIYHRDLEVDTFYIPKENVGNVPSLLPKIREEPLYKSKTRKRWVFDETKKAQRDAYFDVIKMKIFTGDCSGVGKRRLYGGAPWGDEGLFWKKTTFLNFYPSPKKENGVPITGMIEYMNIRNYVDTPTFDAMEYGKMTEEQQKNYMTVFQQASTAANEKNCWHLKPENWVKPSTKFDTSKYYDPSIDLGKVTESVGGSASFTAYHLFSKTLNFDFPVESWKKEFITESEYTGVTVKEEVYGKKDIFVDVQRCRVRPFTVKEKTVGEGSNQKKIPYYVGLFHNTKCTVHFSPCFFNGKKNENINNKVNYSQSLKWFGSNLLVTGKVNFENNNNNKKAELKNNKDSFAEYLKQKQEEEGFQNDENDDGEDNNEGNDNGDNHENDGTGVPDDNDDSNHNTSENNNGQKGDESTVKQTEDVYVEEE